jgi:hypothetical protein
MARLAQRWHAMREADREIGNAGPTAICCEADSTGRMLVLHESVSAPPAARQSPASQLHQAFAWKLVKVLPLTGSVPELSEMRPLLRSAVVNPEKVTEAVGLPGAVACSVSPVNPVAP